MLDVYDYLCPRCKVEKLFPISIHWDRIEFYCKKCKCYFQVGFKISDIPLKVKAPQN